MVIWIAVGAIVLGVLILAAAVMAVLGRLRPLADAGRRLRLRAEQAQQLQTKVEALRANIAGLEIPVAEATRRAERLQRQAGRLRRRPTRSRPPA